MNKTRLYFCLVATVFVGCARPKEQAEEAIPPVISLDNLKDRDVVSYYDRNGDGAVDLEEHHYKGVADADWELRDDNYDKRFERKIVFGIGGGEKTVDLPVPTNVTIQLKR